MVSCLKVRKCWFPTQQYYGYWEVTIEGTHISILAQNFIRYHRVSVKLQCAFKTQVLKSQATPPITPSTWLPLASCRHRLFLWDNKDFLIVTDYYSRHFEVVQLRDTKSKTIIQKLKSIFARWGNPQKVVSDNGPQYSSQEFAIFA